MNIYVVDAFTDRLFDGNQAAVVPLQGWLPDARMLQIAQENNLSETAFLVQRADKAYEIRWFSPIKEIDFCGHATLASAHVLFANTPDVDTLTFFAKAVGELSVKKLPSGRIRMRFPNRKPMPLAEVPSALLQGLPFTPVAVLVNVQAYFAIYEHEDQVRTSVPHIELLKTLGPRDVVISAPGIEVDCVSRYFWPANGGIEDPVTGSIHAGLAPYWAERLGKNTLVALQASQRSGLLYCEVHDDCVYVSGDCVTYLRGEIQVKA